MHKRSNYLNPNMNKQRIWSMSTNLLLGHCIKRGKKWIRVNVTRNVNNQEQKGKAARSRFAGDICVGCNLGFSVAFGVGSVLPALTGGEN